MPQTVSWDMPIQYDTCKVCSQLLFWEDKSETCNSCLKKEIRVKKK
jgi:hypothetical protein